MHYLAYDCMRNQSLQGYRGKKLFRCSVVNLFLFHKNIGILKIVPDIPNMDIVTLQISLQNILGVRSLTEENREPIMIS